MSVEEHSLNACEGIECAIDVLPACLNHADFFVGKVVNRLFEDVWIWHKVCIEDEEVFALGCFCAILEGSGFEACAVGTMDVLSIEATFDEFSYLLLTNFGGFVGGIVENLDLKFFFGVVEVRDRVEKSLHDVHLIETWELDGNQWQFLEFFGGLRALAGVLEVEAKDH